jgi:hypothetical protein
VRLEGREYRYARWLDAEQRRETWSETVGRYFDFMEGHLRRTHGYTLTPQTRRELEGAVLRLEVMPSMRALMTAGPALERDNVCAYNCSYLPVSSPRAFDECLYILMVCAPSPLSIPPYAKGALTVRVGAGTWAAASFKSSLESGGVTTSGADAKRTGTAPACSCVPSSYFNSIRVISPPPRGCRPASKP